MKKYVKLRLDTLARSMQMDTWNEYGREEKDEALEMIRRCFIHSEIVPGADFDNTYISEDVPDVMFTIGFANNVKEIAETILTMCPLYIVVKHKNPYNEYIDCRDVYKINKGGIYALNNTAIRKDTMFISYDDNPEDGYLGEFRFYDTNE